MCSSSDSQLEAGLGPSQSPYSPRCSVPERSTPYHMTHTISQYHATQAGYTTCTGGQGIIQVTPAQNEHLKHVLHMIQPPNSSLTILCRSMCS